MKRILTTQFLLVFAIITFAQTTPTKEETIKWICEKINAYSNKYQNNDYSHYSQATIEASIGRIIITVSKDEFNSKSYCLYLNDIVNYDDKNSTGGFYFYTYGDKITCTENGAYWGDGGRKFTQSKTTKSSLSLDLDLYKEPDLYNRFKKALNTLIEYNKVNIPKETF